jgi:hypothetical protein
LPETGGVLADGVNGIRLPVSQAVQYYRSINREFSKPGPVRVVDTVLVIRDARPTDGKRDTGESVMPGPPTVSVTLVWYVISYGSPEKAAPAGTYAPISRP